MDYSIGIDLGGTSVKTIGVTPEAKELSRLNVPFDPNQELDWAKKVRRSVQQIQSQQTSSASCIGLSAPGLAAPDGRSIAHMPERLQGLEGFDWTAYLDAPGPVPVLNDAQAALLGEVWIGAGRGSRNVIMLTLGTGVGGAAIVDGNLLRGQIGRAGHLGHISLDADAPPGITGSPGSLENAIGNCTILDRTKGRFQTTHDLVAAHLEGDKEASEVWLKSLWRLSCAIGSFINILDPEIVIIGGGIARAGEALFEPLRRYVAQVEWRPGGHAARILPAQLGEFAGAFGSAWNAMHQ